jgi:beta-glucosidase
VSASARVRALLEQMTLDEKLAQLVGFWVDHGGEVFAPMADELSTSTRIDDVTADGIGHLTRVYGTRPVDPVERAAWLWAQQRRLREQTRLGIPAIVHEECLTGLATWKAATYPTPLAWGATFDPALIEEAGAEIGASMRTLGIHQGLAPVLDVIRDPRWGRVDECIGEDPLLVGTIGTAYVRGLQSTGVDATLKHFLGYSASRAGRNHAPVHAGPREIADVLLPPFEMAIRDGGARSVMNSYSAIDGLPVASDPGVLTDLLRGELGFDGVVVADYFSVAFLERTQGVAADLGDAAVLALTAGIDVELPTGHAFLEPLAERVRDGAVDSVVVDRAVQRVLSQKERLGLLDETFESPPESVDLDSPRHRALARRIAEESIVLLANDGVLPLTGSPRIALIGPNADSSEALMGCYSFANHVLAHHPEVPLGFEIPTVLESLRHSMPDVRIETATGVAVEGDDLSGVEDAVALALDADVAVVVVGDRAGLFGRGTVGEGNDVESLELPGRQRELVEAVVATGTPVVLVILSGRPYAIGWALDGESAAAAVLQAFFPGEEGGTALAAIIAGERSPSGRLPVSIPRSAGAQPYSYLHPLLGGPNEVSSVDPTPPRAFGFGLTYTEFAHSDFVAPGAAPTDGEIEVSVVVENVGDRAGVEVVQLYGHDVVGSVARPVAQLLAFERVALQPGERATVRFAVPSALLGFSDRSLTRIVEPGRIELWVGSSCAHRSVEAALDLVGPVHPITADDGRVARVRVDRTIGLVHVDR